MKIITILSGKGGTGKTTLSSNLSYLWSKKRKIVAADCDADAPNLALALGLEEKNFNNWEEVETNEKAVLDKSKCLGCKKCLEVCNFGAITWDKKNNIPIFNSLLCEGCGACQLICPRDAIKLVKVKNGKIASIKTKEGFRLVTGQLNIGSTGSGKVVSLIKEKAFLLAKKENAELILLDSAAGIGCPVIASIQGSDFIVAITEPTPSGLNDLKRALRTVEHFRIPYGVIINKYDINLKITEKIENFFSDNNISLIGKIKFDRKLVDSLVKMEPISKTNQDYYKLFNQIINKIENLI